MTAGTPVACAAFAVKGLEDVVAAEVRARLPTSDVDIRVKHVLFRTPWSPARLRALRTADDVCVLLARPVAVRTEDELRAAVRDGAGVEAVLPLLRPLRELDGTFSVTVSAVRSPVGPSRRVAEVVSGALRDRLGWTPRCTARAPVDVRVFLDGDYALLGVRVFDEPLSNRGYRTVPVTGSLRPTVAAAMVLLAFPDGPPRRLWDPFCGSGTIPAEAALLGHEVDGTDLDPTAVAAARENLRSVRPDLWSRVEQGDSTTAAVWRRHAGVDGVLSNLPWGKQVAIASRSALYTSVGAGAAAVAARGGRACLLTVEPERLAAAVRRVAPAVPVRTRRLGLLGQTPSLIVVGAEPSG